MKNAEATLASSAALWNRAHLDLNSDETLVQLLDRGSICDWRALYALAIDDVALARRIERLVHEVPLPTVWFWRAAIASLGGVVDYDVAPDESVDW